MKPPSLERKPLLETKEQVMERSRAERFGILGGVLKRITGTINAHVPKSIQNSISTGANFFVGSYKMGGEAVVGKTLAGKKLSPKDRIMYSLISTTGIAFQGLSAYGATHGNMEMIQAGLASYTASWILFGVQTAPEIISNLKELAQTANKPELVKLFTSVEKIFEKFGYDNAKKLVEEVQPKKEQEHAKN